MPFRVHRHQYRRYTFASKCVTNPVTINSLEAQAGVLNSYFRRLEQVCRYDSAASALWDAVKLLLSPSGFVDTKGAVQLYKVGPWLVKLLEVRCLNV